MARRQRFSTTATSAATAGGGFEEKLAQFWKFLNNKDVKERPFKPAETTFVLRNIATLVGNGVPLPRALATIAQEESLAKHRKSLDALRRKVESGAAFSAAVADCPGLGDKVTISQIRIGERAGTLADTLGHLAENQDKTRQLKQQVVKKLAYPGLLVALGAGVITFLLTYVIPVFETTYKDAGVPLPMVTRTLISVGHLFRSYLWIGLPAALLAAVGLKQLRKSETLAARMDAGLLKAPLFGRWMRDIAVLQLMDVLNNLMTAGFTLAESLKQTAESVGNRAFRKGVRNLQMAVERGERFSREIERMNELFPPIVNQLVIVGESTGQLTKATRDICEHLRREIERKTTLMVGLLEPILTISLAAAIAVILLAIYLPMFDMVNTVAK